MRINKWGLGGVVLLSAGTIIGFVFINNSINRGGEESTGVSIMDYVEAIPEVKEKPRVDNTYDHNMDFPSEDNTFLSNSFNEQSSVVIDQYHVSEQEAENNQSVEKKDNAEIEIQSQKQEINGYKENSYDGAVKSSDSIYENDGENEISYKDPTGNKTDILKDLKTENEEQIGYTKEQLEKMQNNNTRVGAGGILKDTITPVDSTLTKSTPKDVEEDENVTEEKKKLADSYNASEDKNFETTRIDVN